ncbi:MAG TPA: glycosyl hydrolase family 18 protein [Chitinophagaceae bacterium]|jgi:chitinase|nr:glycosyl hydrolase family 18 protein [Chitinophagaceae bacterium]
MNRLKIFFVFGLLFPAIFSMAQSNTNFCITGYYAGPPEKLDSFPVGKLTHLVFSFGHLQGNRLHIANAGDTACIKKMVGFKKKYPGLKIILSLGGWGGCADCSPVFATAEGRDQFAASVQGLTNYFKTDGIDLDWEYPAIAGHPGHPYVAADKQNFTLLLKALRKSLGKNKEISFAAGGFNQFIDSSIEWKEAMGIADKVYVMSYDLVHGYSTVSGHHTPLYSTSQQEVSTDNAVKRMLLAGVLSGKIVIGAAFYARMFRVNDTLNNGLYRPGKFYRGISYAHLYDSISVAKGFTHHWDTIANAPYAFNTERKILVTYDDTISVRKKTLYALQKKLGGIMFWQLADDKHSNGLLDAIHDARIGR